MHAERERDQRGAAGRPVRPARDAAHTPTAQKAVAEPRPEPRAESRPLTAAQVVRLQQAAGNASVVQRLAAA
ncbi:hypothetical protein OEIGOIKO_06082 [Streptomyces chrestomyceticus JCM 4735]|uniref:Uncharacterized protein n=1 Tax=Streptomyces chrestomyceticus JCM 4735 TaxID=1306181 RepID=A0A7U9Q0V4_9ACTN|nr:hypothetical protein [Streptomyces chrestomyceticus]GCD38270.1 hypothetical protein OEIGOIKO_06082 [Streptomyces chrestomyceticus JCM 4735]